MKNIISLLLLGLCFVAVSQQKDFDLEIAIDENNNILIASQEVSKRDLKHQMKALDVSRPSINLKADYPLEYNQYNKIKKVASSVFDYYELAYDFPLPEKAEAQYRISGQVKDQNGNVLKNINVIAKGTRTGLVTDENGRFNIRIQEGTESLIVDHKDYQRFQLPESTLAALRETSELVIILSDKKFPL